ncbi:MAG: sodium-dependent transporter, partial [Lachnospiraceae bacterium]|nr:sodium-dependent transporter [Lachnospiraceae bacterium]
MNERSSFSGKIGFVLAAAGSAVGLGNIWRFPYLAAKNGGGLFLLCYIILALTFGFTLLTTEVAIGRKTQQSPRTAYGIIHKGWDKLGILSCIVPIIILPYYCAIGGWVLKYFCTFIAGNVEATVEDGYFTGFITSDVAPIIYAIIFIAATAIIVYLGVEGGIERYSKVLMPALFLMIIGIAIYSLTLKNDANGVVTTGLDGLKVYILPDFTGLTFSKLLSVILDAMGQLFYSISVAMGIMVTYGSYMRKNDDLEKSVRNIEIFDTGIAFLSGMMIIPAVFAFSGGDPEALQKGPTLMF